MVAYKYQLTIDGHGPSYDASIWKLASNSTVFFLRDDSGHALEMFYYPLLQPQINYIPANISQVTAAIRHCQKNDMLCRKVAEGALATMTCFLKLEYMINYTSSILDILSDINANSRLN